MKPEDLTRAVAELKAGHVVVFPTDTVYGAGVAVNYAESPYAVSELKRRAPDKPIAWLIGDVGDLDRYGVNVSPEARRLAEGGWPGALTVIVKASGEVPPAFQSQQGTIGLRVPASATALALIREVGPLATSSANRAGQNPSCRCDDIDEGLLAEVAAIVRDDGECSGIASTVIDASGRETAILRD